MASAAATLSAELKPAVLVVSAQPEVRARIVHMLEYAQWRTLEADGGAEALSKLEESGCHVLLLDSVLPDLESEEVSSLAQRRYPGLSVVTLEGTERRPVAADQNVVGAAGDLMRLLAPKVGAEYGEEPEALPPRMPPSDAEGRYRTALPATAELLPGMIGKSQEMARVYRMARLVAPRNTPVLIAGATGTGKELVARAIHNLSPRANKNLVTINCAAIPETLLESELFGYLRGAFTGAVQSRIGRIHAAHNGTLFLDEIGDMPVNLQSKLLRFLENGEVQRLGSTDVFRVDVRVIAATNLDLERRVRNGSFREDLYFRLSVFPISLPPLSRRGGDVPVLAEYFLRELGCGATRLSKAALEALAHHPWPGNVRELRHVIERASILAEASATIDLEHIVLSSQWQAAS